MKYELPWKLLYIKTAISQSCLLIRSRLNIVLLYIVNWRIFMQCRKIHGNFFGQTQTVFWKLCQSPISLLCFGVFLLFFISITSNFIWSNIYCYVCFCAAHSRPGFEHRQFLRYYCPHLYVDTCCMITAIDLWHRNFH